MKLLSGVGTIVTSNPCANPPFPRFLGTCFAYKEPWFFITAAHCVEGYDATDIGVIAPGPYGTGIAIREIGLAPPADIAVLRATDSGRWLSGVEPYREIQQEYELAQDFVTYGFPERTVGLVANNPDPLIFKGHFINLKEIEQGRYRYVGSEMSIPAPAGLSGSPCFPPDQPDTLIAMVTSEYNRYRVVETYTEQAADAGPDRIIEVRQQISYGTALMLKQASVWLDAQLATGPAEGGTE